MLEDRAVALEGEALQVDQGLYGALRIDAKLPEAHGSLCLRHEERHRQAEGRGDRGTLSRAELLLRQHVDSLPSDHTGSCCVGSLQNGVGLASVG